MIHATYRTRILAGLLVVSSLGSISTKAVDAAHEATSSWGVPLLTGLAAGALVNYCMSKRTIEAEREKAASIVYAYQNHYYIPTVEEINHAYWVLSATDEGLEDRLHWDNIWGTLFGGSVAGGIMYCLLNGKGGGQGCHFYPVICWPTGGTHYAPPCSR